MSNTITLKDGVRITQSSNDAIIVHHDGDNRAIMLSELKEMADSDNPVTVR